MAVRFMYKMRTDIEEEEEEMSFSGEWLFLKLSGGISRMGES